MSTKFLFLDHRLYEYSRGFERRLNQPVAYSGNPIMEPELPQEFNRVLLYGSVIRDPESGLLRMWYNSSTREESLSNLLYAESDDDYGWRKPALDVIPGTNIVMDNDWDIHGPTIILDEAETDGARRYKMVARRARGALAGYISPDGIHWRLLRDEPSIYADSDCHIGFFRDPESGLYRTSFRDACPDRRMWRSESEDFVTWRRPVLALEPDIHDPIQTQIYSLQMTPYGAYVLGWLHRYTTWESDMGPTKMNGNWDIELAFSRGGYCWHRPAQGEDSSRGTLAAGPQDSSRRRRRRCSSTTRLPGPRQPVCSLPGRWEHLDAPHFHRHPGPDHDAGVAGRRSPSGAVQPTLRTAGHRHARRTGRLNSGGSSDRRPCSGMPPQRTARLLTEPPVSMSSPTSRLVSRQLYRWAQGACWQFTGAGRQVGEGQTRSRRRRIAGPTVCAGPGSSCPLETGSSGAACESTPWRPHDIMIAARHGGSNE